MKLSDKESAPVVEMLEKSSLWSGLSKKDLKSIVRLSKERTYETGDVIVQKGEGGVGFYLILKQFFGEMSVIDNQPRSADVVAVEPSRCLILSAWSFNALISENPKIALKMLQEFVRRLRSTNQALHD